MKKQGNWELISRKNLPDMDLTLFEYRHLSFGTPYVHISSASKENVFAVAFRTLPQDGSGLPHILEHSVLAGSKKYPVKDPFFSMLNRSLASFMNAFTARNWTAYPFATENKQDFYNLLDVYLDAVFFPCLSRKSFQQEGVRLDYDGRILDFKGVVYNEMKGVYSSVPDLAEEAVLKSLFPTTPYRFDSGGDPREIIALKYQDFVNFHKQYYHPGNALFFSFGNFKHQEHFKFLEKAVFRKFQPKKQCFGLFLEKPFLREKKLVFPIPPQSPTDKLEQKIIAWRLDPVTDARQVLAFEILEEVLLNDEYGLLKKALVRSGLGQDLSDSCGFNCDLYETYFTVGLKGLKKAGASRLEELVLKELDKIRRAGIPRDYLEAAINKLAIEHRDISSGHYPYGLNLYLRLLGPWLYGESAADAVDFERIFKQISPALSQRMLEDTIREKLLGNKNRASITLRPSPSYFEDLNAPIKSRLSRVKRQAGRMGLERIAADNKRLARKQNRKEPLSCLPIISLEKISPKVKTVRKSQSGQVFKYQLFNNNLTQALFCLENRTNVEYLPFVPLFCYGLPRLGSKKYPEEAWRRELNKRIGDIGLSPLSLSREGRDHEVLVLRFNAQNSQAAKALALARDLVKAPRTGTAGKWQPVLGEYQARLQSSFVRSGHQLAATRAASVLARRLWVKELWEGASQLAFLKNLKAEALPPAARAIAKNLSLQDYPLAVFSDPKNYPFFKRAAKELSLAPAKSRLENTAGFAPGRKREFLIMNTELSYAASVFKTPDIRHQDAAPLEIACRVLGAKFLHREIREKNGAYGAYAVYNALEGVVSLMSYRDPGFPDTLAIFGQARNFLSGNGYSAQDVKEGIIKTIASFDRPSGPGEMMQNDYIRHLIGLSDRERQKYRERLLAVTKKDIKLAAEKYFQPDWRKYSTVVLTNQAKAEKYGRIEDFKFTNI